MSAPEEAMQTEHGWRDVTVKVENIGRKLFATDGMLSELQKKIRAFMTSPDRGPDPDFSEDEERVTIPVRWLERAMKPRGGYHESGSQLLKWILGVLAILTASVIIGGVSFYGRFTAFESGVTEWQKATDRRLDNLERKP